MNDSHAVVSVEQTASNLPVNAAELIFNDGAFSRLEKLATIMSSGKITVPAHLRGNAGDCFAIAMQAIRWRMDPFAVAQKTFNVGGVLGYEAQLVSAVINSSGAVLNRFNFEWYGPWEKVIGKYKIKSSDKGEYRVPSWSLADEEGIGIKVSAILKGESEPRTLDLLLAQARTRNSTLWADDPKQQLAYLAQKRWARLYAPDVILGVYTKDELDESPQPRDMGQAEVISKKPASSLSEKLASSKPGEPTLEAALAAIDAFENRETQTQAKAAVEALAGTPHYQAALEAYKAKTAALKARHEAQQKSTTIDGNTGEILNVGNTIPPPFDEAESRRLDAELAEQEANAVEWE